MLDTVQVRPTDYVVQGTTQIVIRLRLDDRNDITTAAHLLGLTQAQFVRNVLVQTARVVIAEMKSEEAA